MGLFDLFDKRQKLDFNNASGVMLTACISFANRGGISQQRLNIEEKHMMTVNTGYMLGISMLYIASQIKIERTNEFIEAAMKNASEILLPEMQVTIPKMKECALKTKDYMIKEAMNIGIDNLFVELAKRYLNDLLGERKDKNQYLNAAIEEVKYYYATSKQFAEGIKILK